MRTRLAVATLVLLLVSCGPPSSLHPLTPEKDAKPDKALVGNWVGTDAKADAKDKDKTVELHVTVKAGGTMSFVLPSDTKDGKDSLFEGHFSPVGSMRILNLREITEPAREDRDYLFVRYEVDRAGALTLWFLREDPLKAAIRSGVLKGEITGSPESVRITDEPAAIIRYLTDPKRKDLFEKAAVFHRVRP